MELKAYKIELYVTALNDSDLEHIEYELNNIDDVSVCIGDIEEVDVEWHDEIDLNYSDKKLAAYRELFRAE